MELTYTQCSSLCINVIHIWPAVYTSAEYHGLYRPGSYGDHDYLIDTLKKE